MLSKASSHDLAFQTRHAVEFRLKAVTVGTTNVVEQKLTTLTHTLIVLRKRMGGTFYPSRLAKNYII